VVARSWSTGTTKGHGDRMLDLRLEALNAFDTAQGQHGTAQHEGIRRRFFISVPAILATQFGNVGRRDECEFDPHCWPTYYTFSTSNFCFVPTHFFPIRLRGIHGKAGQGFTHSHLARSIRLWTGIGTALCIKSSFITKFNRRYATLLREILVMRQTREEISWDLHTLRLV